MSGARIEVGQWGPKNHWSFKIIFETFVVSSRPTISWHTKEDAEAEAHIFINRCLTDRCTWPGEYK